MKYLKVFENQAEESAWKESEEYIKTSLSMDRENMDELSYNSKVKFRAEYNLEGLEGDVKLMNCGNIFDSLKVNGAEAVTGTVEATREEVKCGKYGNKVAKEVIINSTSFEQTENGDFIALDENIWFSTFPTSEFTIQLMDDGDISENGMVFSIGMGTQISPMMDVDPSLLVCINENERIYQFKDKLGDDNEFLYNIFMFVCAYGASWTILSSKAIKLRDFTNEGEINEKEFTITSDDFSIYDGTLGNEALVGNLYLPNLNKVLTNPFKECVISTDIVDENTGVILQGYSAQIGGLVQQASSMEEAIEQGMVTPKTSTSFALPLTLSSVLGVTYDYIVLYFVDMSKIELADNGYDTKLIDPSAIKTTNVFLEEMIYDNQPYYNINSTNVDELSEKQFSSFYELDFNRGYWFVLIETDENGERTTNCHILTENALHKNNDYYSLTNEGINEIKNVINTNTSWVMASIFGAGLVQQYGGLPVESFPVLAYPYLIIQESISGGAPKELSVDASVGKVSLIGEVNDYFSTLPSNGFEGCPLETVIIPDNIKSIGTKCFGHCDRLKKVYLPQNMDKLADYSFGGNSVKRGNVVNVRSVKNESPLAFGNYGGEVELYEWVDLGLSVKWAAWNVGATKPEEYGLYFAWGETQGYTGITDEKQFSWGDYKWSSDAEGTTMTKYNATDGLTTLEASDDAATATDSSCRMPTEAELKELMANTTSAYTQVNGVSCISLTSKVNGNSIFVPAADYCLDGSVIIDGQNGYLWSSSVDSSNIQRSFYLYFNSVYASVINGGGSRYIGLHVRAVKE